MPTRGITVSLWKTSQNWLQQKVGDLCLRRDAFLARIVESELPRLKSEIEMPVSESAAALIRRDIQRLDTETVTFRFPDDVVAELDDVCKTRNIVRDAFFNRLVFALCVPPNTFLSCTELAGHFADTGEFRIAGHLSDAGWESEAEEFRKGALDAAITLLDDPLWVVRACLEVASKPSEDLHYTFYNIPLAFDKVRGFQGLNVTRSEPTSDEIVDLDVLLGISQPENKKRRTR